MFNDLEGYFPLLLNCGYRGRDIQDFNFRLLKDKLNENELEIVYSYVRRNRETSL